MEVGFIGHIRKTKIAAAWVNINIQTVNALTQVAVPDCKA